MKRIIQLRDPMYLTDIILLWEATKEDLSKYIWKRFKTELDPCIFDGSGVCFHMEKEGEPDFIVIGLKEKYDGSPSVISTLTHECFHATAAVMRSRGLSFSGKSEEAYSYYLGWMMYNLTERMTQVELKIADKL